LLTGLSQLPAVKKNNTRACCALFAKLLQQYPDYVTLGLVDYRGTIVASARPFDLNVNLADQAYIRRALRTGIS
jgi:hypothetical protein